MTAALAAEPALVQPPYELFRVGRSTGPFRWKDSAYLDLTGASRASGYRFDAPAGEYRSLYFGTSARAALIEVLAPFRKPADPLVGRMDAFFDEDGDPSFEPVYTAGSLEPGFFDTRALGIVQPPEDAQFIDVDQAATHTAVQTACGPELLEELGLEHIDRSTFLSPDRRVTRTLAGVLHNAYAHQAVGLRYVSRIDASAECWMLWDPRPELLGPRDIRPLDVTTADVLEAASVLQLKTT